MSTDRRLTHFEDAGADGDDGDVTTIPSLPGADVQEVDVLLARDDKTGAWTSATEIDADDVEDGERRGVFYVEEQLAIMVAVAGEDRWHGWCECDSDYDPCRHLCRLAQLGALDHILPEVDLA